MISKTNFRELATVVDPALEKHAKLLVVFKGTKDEVTGENWCSDCVKAEPVINEFLLPKAKEEGIPVIFVDCGLRDEWVNPENEARKHKIFNITGVPTVALIEDGALVTKLMEEELFDGDIVATL